MTIGRLSGADPPKDGSELRGVDGPPEGESVPIRSEEPQLTSPIGPDGIDAGLVEGLGEKRFGKETRKKSNEPTSVESTESPDALPGRLARID